MGWLGIWFYSWCIQGLSMEIIKMHMKKRFFLFTCLSLIMSLSAHTQEFSSVPAILAVHIDNSEPLLKIRGVRNYNVYSMSVDTVLFVNVSDNFKDEFNEQYLLRCKYLIVCLDTSQYYQTKTDWDIGEKYIIETDAGFGIGDLTFYRMGKSAQYEQDPYGIRIGSWGLLPESIKEMFLIPIRDEYEKGGDKKK